MKMSCSAQSIIVIQSPNLSDKAIPLPPMTIILQWGRFNIFCMLIKLQQLALTIMHDIGNRKLHDEIMNSDVDTDENIMYKKKTQFPV